MSPLVESGIVPLRVHFVRETTTGVFPADPSFLRYSDSLIGMTAQPNTNPFNRRPVGEVDIAEAHPGPEDHEVTIQYHLQNALTAANDAAADFFLRAADNDLLNTHGIVARQEFTSGGELGGGFRIYTVVSGGIPSQAQIDGSPDTGEPIPVNLTYMAEKVRSYIIHQPTSGSTVSVESTSTADTTQDVTIENEGAATSETLSLNGTTPVAGATSFTDIDSISLDADTVGDVIVNIGATEICRILGRTSLTTGEGDLGIPALGTGSFETTLGTAFETFLDDTFTWGGASLVGENGSVLGTGVQVVNNIEVTPRIATRRKRYSVGVRDLTVTATVFAAYQSHDDYVNNLKVLPQNFVWTLTGSTVTIQNAVLTGLGPRSIQQEEAIMRRDNTFTGQGITIA